MSSFFKNPIVHGITVGLVSLLGWFLTSGSPILTITFGSAGAALLAYLTSILD